MVSPIIQTMAVGANAVSNTFRTSEEALQGALNATNSIVRTSNSMVNIANQKVSLDMKMFNLVLNAEEQKFRNLMAIKQFQLNQAIQIKNLQLKKIQLQQNAIFNQEKMQLANNQLNSNNIFNEESMQLKANQLRNNSMFKLDQLGLQEKQMYFDESNNIERNKLQAQQNFMNNNFNIANIDINYKNLQLNRDKFAELQKQDAITNQQNQERINIANQQAQFNMFDANRRFAEQQKQDNFADNISLLNAKSNMERNKVLAQKNVFDEEYKMAILKKDYFKINKDFEAKLLKLNSDNGKINIKNMANTSFNVNGKQIKINAANLSQVNDAISYIQTSPTLDPRKKQILTQNLLARAVALNGFNYDNMAKQKNGNNILSMLGNTKEAQKANIFRIFANSKGINLNKMDITNPEQIKNTFAMLDKNTQTRKIAGYFLSFVKQVSSNLYKTGNINQQSYNNINRFVNNIILGRNIVKNINDGNYDKVSKTLVNRPDWQTTAFNWISQQCGNSIDCENLNKLADKTLLNNGYNISTNKVGKNIKTIALGSNFNYISKKIATLSNIISTEFGVNINGVTEQSNTDVIKNIKPSAFSSVYIRKVNSLFQNEKFNEMFKQYKLSPIKLIAAEPAVLKSYEDKFFRKDNKTISDIEDTFRESFDTNGNKETILYPLALAAIKYNIVKRKNPKLKFGDYIANYNKKLFNTVLDYSISDINTGDRISLIKSLNKIRIDDNSARQLLKRIAVIAAINETIDTINRTIN